MNKLKIFQILTDNKVEIWRPIITYNENGNIKHNFTGIYEVSNLGNVRSLNRFVINSKEIKSFYKGKPKSTSLDKDGYVKVSLLLHKKQYLLSVHRLVLFAFESSLKIKEQVNHKNGKKGDNLLTNLEWVTQSENERHSIDVLGKTAWNKGLSLPQELKDRIRKNAFVRHDSEHPSAKIIHQYSLEGVYIQTFYCIKAVIKWLNEQGLKSNLHNCIWKAKKYKKPNIICSNYIWVLD